MSFVREYITLSVIGGHNQICNQIWPYSPLIPPQPEWYQITGRCESLYITMRNQTKKVIISPSAASLQSISHAVRIISEGTKHYVYVTQD